MDEENVSGEIKNEINIIIKNEGLQTTHIQDVEKENNIDDKINKTAHTALVQSNLNTESLCVRNDCQSNMHEKEERSESKEIKCFVKTEKSEKVEILETNIQDTSVLNLSLNYSKSDDPILKDETNRESSEDIESFAQNTSRHYSNVEITNDSLLKDKVNTEVKKDEMLSIGDINRDEEYDKIQNTNRGIDLTTNRNNNVINPTNFKSDNKSVESNSIQTSINSKEDEIITENKTEASIKVELEEYNDDSVTKETEPKDLSINSGNVTVDTNVGIAENNKVEQDKSDICIKIEKDDCTNTDDIENTNIGAKEVPIKKEKESEEANEVEIKQEYDDINTEITPQNECSIKIVSIGSLKVELQHNDANIKQETTGDDLTSYSYPNFDDSMDSNDAAAFCKVETCLQEDGRDDSYDDPDHLYKVIKEEENLTVTDTHLISNKFTDASSMIPYEMLDNDSFVMEINPMPGDYGMKPANPEAILPDHEFFQLNSITGNVISLEEEAYDLLKAKSTKKPGKRHPCPKCQQTYSSVGCLRKHLKIHMNNEAKSKKQKEVLSKKKKIYSSSNVKKKEVKKSPIAEIPVPVKKCNSDYQCVCGAVFSRKIRLETCMKSHNADANINRVQCLTCTRSFNSKDELEFHRKKIHRKRFPCKFCPTDYDSGKDLFEHLKLHRQVQLTEFKVISEVVQGQEILKCLMCTNSFKELPQLKNHVMIDHTEPYSCRYCKGSYPNILDFANHIKTTHPDVEGQSVLDVLEAFSKLVQAWKCEDCGMQFHEADKLALHQAETHNPDLKTRPQIQCEDCRRVFLSQKGLQSHRRVHHSVEVEATAPEETGVMCAECRKICKDMEALTSHMRLHSPDRKFPCKFCDFRFATAEKRRVHQEIHTGDMKFVCFICEYQCTSENRLKMHKRSAKHQTMKQYLMSGAFLNEDKTENERRDKEEKRVKKRKKERDRSSSSDSSDGSVLCDVCGDKFTSKKEMLEHKTSHPFIEFPNEDTPRIFFKYH